MYVEKNTNAQGIIQIYLVYFLFLIKFILRTNNLQKREEIEIFAELCIIKHFGSSFLLQNYV